MTVRVLIVDDQEPFRAVARAVVELTDGFDVVGEAESGEESITAAQTLNPELVLMDVNLPGISGLEATRRILAAHAAGPPVVVLVLSTYEAAEYGPQAEEVGAACFIPKSEFSPERLTDAWASAGHSTGRVASG
ncbi:MAG: response regulator transcription factor [Candidatus Dormibacteraeota bacterium]|nr:response regulator transcription factor [Candidatus Dormibacteraeota bacterium]